MMIEVNSRYGKTRAFYTCLGVWYFDPGDSLRTSIGEDESGMIYVDPDGGPWVCVGSTLNTYHDSLPKLEITAIEYCEPIDAYRLETKEV